MGGGAAHPSVTKLEVTRFYDGYRAVYTSLKIQPVSFFKGTCMSPLKNSYIGYDTKSTLVLITHLYANYALISTTDMVANDKRLIYPYNA